jgi:hypothetical protein
MTTAPDPRVRWCSRWHRNTCIALRYSPCRRPTHPKRVLSSAALALLPYGIAQDVRGTDPSSTASIGASGLGRTSPRQSCGPRSRSQVPQEFTSVNVIAAFEVFEALFPPRGIRTSGIEGFNATPVSTSRRVLTGPPSVALARSLVAIRLRAREPEVPRSAAVPPGATSTARSSLPLRSCLPLRGGAPRVTSGLLLPHRE